MNFFEKLFASGTKGAENKSENPPRLFRMPDGRIKIETNGTLFNATPEQIEQAKKAGAQIKDWRSEQEEKTKNYKPGDTVFVQGRKREVKEFGILGRPTQKPEEEKEKKS